MARKPIRVGSTGILRAKFTDSSGVPLEATGLEVNLYAPDTFNIDPPVVSGLVPTYLGEGVFQLTVTGLSPGGDWVDEWTGDILGISTTANFSYQVLEGGQIIEYPVLGPSQNNLIEVTLASGVMGLDGSYLDSETTFFFTTQYSPLYADGKKARLISGGILSNVPDYTLYSALLEASIEADIITFAKSVNRPLYDHARREYTACKAALTVAQNILADGGILKSKRLADFSVQYETSSMMDLVNSLMGTCKRWAPQVETGGQARAIRDPKMVIKGELDPDRPKFGRGWSEVGTSEKPFGNAKELPRGSRRYSKTYRNSNSKKDWGDW